MVGYIFLTTSQLAVHISKVAVATSFQRRGIATRLVQVQFKSSCHYGTRVQAAISLSSALQEAVDRARLRRATTATLHVDPTNGAAVGLYQSLGFKVDAVLDDYYAPGRPAWRMITSL